MNLGVALLGYLRSYDELDIRYVAIKRIARPNTFHHWSKTPVNFLDVVRIDKRDNILLYCIEQKVERRYLREAFQG